jgi:hypothetical protein
VHQEGATAAESIMNEPLPNALLTSRLAEHFKPLLQ